MKHAKPNKTRHGREILTPIQKLVAVEIAAGKTITSIAECHRVSRSTISEWLQNPHFIQAVNIESNKITEALRTAFTDRTKQLVDSSLDTLLNAVKSGDRVAATFILSQAKGFTSHVESSYDTLITLPAIRPETLPEICKELAKQMTAEFLQDEGCQLSPLFLEETMQEELESTLLEQYGIKGKYD